MKIGDLLKPESVCLDAPVQNKTQAVDKLAELLSDSLYDAQAFKKEIWKREAHATTAVGGGIAVPHAKSSAVKRAALAVLTVRERRARCLCCLTARSWRRTAVFLFLP